MITVNDEIREELLHSKSFLKWSPGPKPSGPQSITIGRGREFIYQGETHTNLIVDEKHFSPDELAQAWGVSAQTVRNVFKDEPDVLRLGNPTPSRRNYFSLRIPQSVAMRVHRRLSAIPK